ncbi:MAG: hypothetical protein NXI24_24400 [bacterium]|nr:hypothetical protein [bacterium]
MQRDLSSILEPRLLALLCAGVIWLSPAVGRAQSPTGTEKSPSPAAASKEPAPEKAADREPPRGCALYLAMARSAVPSRERSFGLRALKACPASPAIARALEAAIARDDYAARAAALASLETHLDRASIPFLVDLYDSSSAPADFDAESEVLLFEYLSELAAPADPAAKNQPQVPARILARGLYHQRSRIRQAALRGIGRLDQADHWPLLQAVLLDPAGPGEYIAALQAARTMSNRDSLAALAAARAALGFPSDDAIDAAIDDSNSGADENHGKQAAGHTNPGLERAAIELLGALPGPRALETLLIYRVLHATGGGGANGPLLEQAINARLQPGKNYAWSIAPARLHRQATERSPIQAAVAAHTILYIEESTGLGYRLPPTGQRRQPESNWLRVRTTAGLTGWIHASRIQRIAKPAQSR